MASQTTTTMRTEGPVGGSSTVTKTTTYETRSSSSYVADASQPAYRPSIAPRTYVIQRTAIGGLGSAPGGGGSMTRTVERSAHYGALSAGAPAGTLLTLQLTTDQHPAEMIAHKIRSRILRPCIPAPRVSTYVTKTYVDPAPV